MPSAKEEFNERVNRLLRQGRDLPEEVIRGMIRELEAARREVLARMASIPNENYTRFQLQRVEQEIDSVLGELNRRLAQDVMQGQRRGWQLGQEVVDEPFGRAGFGFSFTRLSFEDLAAAQELAALRITQIGAETRGKIAIALRRSFAGGKPFHETIREIAGALGGEEKAPSLWSQAGERAFRIAATEIPTIQSIASASRINQMADRLGKDSVHKRWAHHPVARVPRVGHLLLDKQHVPVDEKFVNPETHIALAYPHDPEAPASEVIQCSCSVAPHIVASSALDKQFEASRARALAA